MKNYTDEQLVQLFISGSSDSLEELVDRYRRQLQGYLISIVGQKSAADDVFQETFIKIIEHLKRGKYTDSGKFSSWLFRVGHNTAIDYLRKQQGTVDISDVDNDYSMHHFEAEETEIERFNVEEENKGTLRSLVCRLPKEQCEVLMMRYYMDLNFREIAEHLGIGLSTALGRMRYAISNLQKMIEKESPDIRMNWRVAA
jgi:RNA polymerase sigma-70 factor (ECF subfamily)